MNGQDRKQQAGAVGARQESTRESWARAQLRDRIQRVLLGDSQGAAHAREPEPSPQPDLEAEP